MPLTGNAVLSVGLFSLLVLSTAPAANAQITRPVKVDISHSFIVSTKTLPPGTYTFRMQEGAGGGVMTVTSADRKNSDYFVVRESQAQSTPAHTELVFRRYGDKEFLTKIYQSGNKLGVAVAEPSKVEKELMARGEQPSEHTEGGQ